MKNSDDPQWERTRQLLREHLVVPPPDHPDFINSQVLAMIRHEEATAGGTSTSAPPLWSLGRLLWPSLATLAAAIALSFFLLPRDFAGRGTDDFISQVIAVQTANPQTSVTSFRVPDDAGVVLWIEGVDYIPATHQVQ